MLRRHLRIWNMWRKKSTDSTLWKLKVLFGSKEPVVEYYKVLMREQDYRR